MGNYKLTLEQKKHAVELAAKGENPLEYLKNCGAKNPSAAWVYIKKTLAEKDPATLEKITGQKNEAEDQLSGPDWVPMQVPKPGEKSIVAMTKEEHEKTHRLEEKGISELVKAGIKPEGTTEYTLTVEQLKAIGITGRPAGEITAHVDTSETEDLTIMQVGCKGYIFTNLPGGGLLIEKPERGQALTVEKDEVMNLVGGLAEV